MRWCQVRIPSIEAARLCSRNFVPAPRRPLMRATKSAPSMMVPDKRSHPKSHMWGVSRPLPLAVKPRRGPRQALKKNYFFSKQTSPKPAPGPVVWYGWCAVVLGESGSSPSYSPRFAALEMFGTFIPAFHLLARRDSGLLALALELIADNQGNACSLLSGRAASFRHNSHKHFNLAHVPADGDQ